MPGHNRILKKGNLADIPTALGILLSLVFVFFIVSTILSNVNTNIVGNNATNMSEATSFLDTYETRFSNGWDFGVLFLAILLPVFSYIAAKRIPTRPSTMIILVFVLGFFLIISMIFSNIYGKLLENTLFAAWASGLTFIPFIMPKLLYYSVFYIIIVVIGLFSKEEGSL